MKIGNLYKKTLVDCSDSAQSLITESLSEVRTERLFMRPWRESDLEPFAAMNADPRVMKHFPARLSRVESDGLVDRFRKHWTENGFGFWAIEIPSETSFIGFTGLSRPTFNAHFTPCVEVAWRLSAQYWGHGFATEAARAAVRLGFLKLALSEIVSFTVPANHRSLRVMEKLGMHHDSRDDFDHPRLPENHPLRRHVLYRLSRHS